MTHLDHIERLIGPLAGKRVLDLGCGTGWFLIDAAKRGIPAVGLESSPAYIAQAHAAAKVAGVSIEVANGMAEALPFPDASFDFANVNEVIEHVEDPRAMLAELNRVLVPGGAAYLSVPNRFGFKDQHFHLYFVNWLPRAWSDAFIAVFGKHKNYAEPGIGRQRLSEMHYYTHPAARALFAEAGFRAQDIRSTRIEREYAGPKRMLAAVLYPFARDAYFDAFHFLLTKRG